MDKKNLLFEIKPKYKVPYILMTHLLDLIIILVILFYMGSLPNMLFKTISTAVIIAIFVFCFTALRRKHHNRLYFYRFYPDRLIYRDTFFNKKVKEIKYKNIKDIKYSQSFLQVFFKLGEITIITNDKNIMKKVIYLKLIPNVEKNYKRIEEVLNKKDD